GTGPAGLAPPGGGQPPRSAAGRSRAGLIAGIVAAAVVLLLLTITGAVLLKRSVARSTPDVAEPTGVTTPDEPKPGDEGSGEKRLAIGERAELSRHWAVYVTRVEWFDKRCIGGIDLEHPVVVFDVTFEVYAGTVEMQPYHFDYITDSGYEAPSDFFSRCDEPQLEGSEVFTAGDRVTGKIAFEVPGGEGGTLTYWSVYGANASWIVPGRP
ncbi:MAG: hypothetical protein IRY85_08550, partial [Micromonosporaceae bacterium]|nr:hypothetical protein [Micromonosporaceae bacterium]